MQVKEMIKKVSEFHYAFGVERGNVDVELRYKLFKEEFEEYKDAKTLVDKADAIVDMLYIACGTIDLHKWSADYESMVSLKEKEVLELIEYFNNKYLNKTYKESSILELICLVNRLAELNNIYDILPQLFNEVHLSNLSKLDENGKPIINDGILDPSKPIGKILKGKNYFEPRLKEILENGN